MRHITYFGIAAVALFAIGCSDSTTTAANTSNWSGAVLKASSNNPSAQGTLRGVVVDSVGSADPSTYVPIVGATVVLNLKIQVPPATAGDTATTTVTKIGEVVTDANGRFLVTNIPEGDYFIEATPPDQEHYNGMTWGFASSGSNQRDAVIYLPRRAARPPGDPIDSM